MGLIITFIILGIIILGCIVVAIIKNVDKKNMKITKELSGLYKTILSTNKKYNFHNDIRNNLNFNPCLKSKRSLDNFDLSQYVMNEINGSKNYYETLFAKADKNRSDFSNYINEYKKIEKYTTNEEFLKFKDVKIKYKTFNKYEKKLYFISMLNEPVVSISANCHATYTSPSGRNSYWKNCDFSFDDLKLFLKRIKQQEEYLLLEMQRKEEKTEEKRAKEKKLRELDKFEKQLAQEKEQHNQKEKEFLEATQGHIYSSQKSTNEKIEENESVVKDESPYVKLKKLKQMFDNGEIDFKEYNKRKNELI